MLKYFITTDPYSDVSSYNYMLEALKNNKVQYKEFISTKPPYNWYINTDYKPIFVNYDNGEKNDMRFLVAKIQPLRPNEEYLLKRRETDGSSAAGIEKFIENSVFSRAKNKYALCFRYKSKQELFQLSQKIKNNKIYLLGTFKGRKLAITYNKYAVEEISPSYIMQEKEENMYNGLGEFEMAINYFGLKKRDKIIKYTQTPYIMNGKYYPTKLNI